MKHLSNEDCADRHEIRQRVTAAGEQLAGGSGLRLDALSGRITIEERAQRGRPGGMRALLEMVPAAPPMPGDAI